ncbi:hypothetical protein EAVNNN508_00820 [Elizabethkingia anophelis]|nr:hypothetical protein EAVNVB490_01341 [Elizabethkingia anophelis]CAI9673457.1 hypothetical protein EAVNVB490_00822 [Elizabethkingia anophelis]CAI9678886.1 hypothetical protein EAVNNN508_00820 [Elizabethkingia anophelis]
MKILEKITLLFYLMCGMYKYNFDNQLIIFSGFNLFLAYICKVFIRQVPAFAILI